MLAGLGVLGCTRSVSSKVSTASVKSPVYVVYVAPTYVMVSCVVLRYLSGVLSPVQSYICLFSLGSLPLIVDSLLFLIYIISSTLSFLMAYMSLPIVTLAIACRFFILVTYVLHFGLDWTINIMLRSIGWPTTKPMSMPVIPSLT